MITLDLTINSSSEIDVFDNKYEIQVFPNPTKDDLNILLDKNKIEEFILLDIHGRVIFHQSGLINKDRIDLSHFVSGTYFLKIITSEGIRNIRVIKN